MDECKDCEYMGYSPQVCRLHTKSCKKMPERAHKKLPTSVKVGATTLAGAGLGMAAAVIGSTAVSLVGGAALIHALMLKLGAGGGLAGGSIGFFKGLNKTKRNDHPAE